MDRIPEELLVAVFKLHVWCSLDTPQRLLRVCRRWHNVTTNTGSLWGDIILTANRGMLNYYILKNPSLARKTYCDSLEGLARAIERTGGSKFELTIALRNDGSINTEGTEFLRHTWSPERCRALRIIDYNIQWSGEFYKNLVALEELEVSLQCDPSGEIQNGLLDHVERTSKLLWRLQLNGHTPVEFVK